MALTGQEHLFLDSFSMVHAYLCHHLSDNYVELSDLYVVLSDLYFDLLDNYVDLSPIHLLENKSLKRVLAQLVPYRKQNYLTSRHI